MGGQNCKISSPLTPFSVYPTVLPRQTLEGNMDRWGFLVHFSGGEKVLTGPQLTAQLRLFLSSFQEAGGFSG